MTKVTCGHCGEDLKDQSSTCGCGFIALGASYKQEKRVDEEHKDLAAAIFIRNFKPNAIDAFPNEKSARLARESIEVATIFLDEYG